jgi:Flp pilus assembly protein CpaB
VTYSVRNIAIAVVMAIAAAAAVLVYTSSYKNSVTRGQKRVEVLVASRDIPAGTKAEDAASAMTLTSVLQDDRAPGSITTTAGLQGKVASQTIFAGQQVLASVFTTGTESNNRSLLLTKTERALRVVCNPDPSCLIGDIKPGDKVDVFETLITPTGMITRLLLPAVTILDVPVPDPNAKSKGLGGGGQKVQSTVLVKTDQKTAAKFAWLNGIVGGSGGGSGAGQFSVPSQVWFAIRPPDGQAEDQPIVEQDDWRMLTDGLPASEVAAIFGNARAWSIAQAHAAGGK